MESAGFIEPEIEAVDFTINYADVDDWWVAQTQMSTATGDADRAMDFATRSDVLAELERAATLFAQPDDSLVIPARTWVAAATAVRSPAMYYDDDADLDLLKGKTVAILGYGSQGHAHARNLKDSGVDVVVGLREGSKSVEHAKAAGLEVTDIADAASHGDIVMVLLPDEKHHDVYEESIKDGVAPGNLLMFGHGFSVHYKEVQAPPEVDVALVAPKGPGHLVRRQYLEGSGVPCLIAIDANATGNAQQLALAYAKGIGGTRGGVIETTFKDETETDLFGEQAVLCGGVSELVSAGYETLVDAGYDPARVLRVPARAQADRGPDVREGHHRDAPLDLQHGRVRRPHARQADHLRDDPPGHEGRPGRDPGRHVPRASGSPRTAPARRTSSACARRARVTRSSARARSCAR